MGMVCECNGVKVNLRLGIQDSHYYKNVLNRYSYFYRIDYLQLCTTFIQMIYYFV